MVLKSLVYLGYLLLKWSQSEIPLVLGLSGVFGTGYPSGSGPGYPFQDTIYGFNIYYLVPTTIHRLTASLHVVRRVST